MTPNQQKALADAEAAFRRYGIHQDVQLADVAAMNIEKLRKRYPARYQHDMAAFRADKQLEIQG